MGLEDIIDARTANASIGFNADIKKNDQKDVAALYHALEPEDLLKFGLIPELVGRLPVVATLNPLDEKALVRVLTEPKNSLVRQYAKMFKIDGVDLEFTDEALHTIAELAVKRESGARGLRGILENIMMPFMYACPGRENLKKLVITKEIVESHSDLTSIMDYLDRCEKSKTGIPEAIPSPCAEAAVGETDSSESSLKSVDSSESTNQLDSHALDSTKVEPSTSTEYTPKKSKRSGKAKKGSKKGDKSPEDK